MNVEHKLVEAPQKLRDSPIPDLQPYFSTLDDLDDEIDWRRFFGNGNPVEIDVGCGRGKFLVEVAESDPGRNFVGIEIDFREGRHGATRLKRRAIENARVIGGDVRIAFGLYIKPASVSHIHVYFPDPWWKRRHRRRRVFTDELVEQMATALEPGGYVSSWTDVEEYFDIIAARMNQYPAFETLPTPTEKTAEHDLDYRTGYERKRRQAGDTIHRGLWRRRE